MSCSSDSDWIDTAEEEIKSTVKPECKMSYAEEAVYKLREKLANNKGVLPEQISTEYLATILANCDYDVEDLLIRDKLMGSLSGITAYDTQEVMEKLDALTLQISALAAYMQPTVTNNKEMSTEENYNGTSTYNNDGQVSYRGVREIFNDRRKPTSSNITPNPIKLTQFTNTKSAESIVDTNLAKIATVGKVSDTTSTQVVNQGKKITITIDLS